MSTLSGGPGPIVTNGLVLYFDAANPRSYVSGSTTWNDLSSNNTSGSLTNVGYDSSKKCLLFASSSNSTCIFNNSSLLNFNTGSFSIEVFVKLTATASGTINTLWQKRNTTSGVGGFPGYQYRILNNTTTLAATIIAVDNGTGANNGDYISLQGSSTTFPYYTFIHSVITFNVSTLKLAEYRNGVLITSEAQNSGIMTGSFYNNNVNFRLGKNEGNSLDAEYYFFRAYNRVLTSTEALQNYNALKSRFNLT
jgi:hypothetical protein